MSTLTDGNLNSIDSDAERIMLESTVTSVAYNRAQNTRTLVREFRALQARMNEQEKKEPLDDAASWRKEARKYRKALERAANNVLIFGARLDALMKLPSSEQRGRDIAKLMNELDTANDLIRYGELGVDFRTDDKKKVLAKLARS